MMHAASATEEGRRFELEGACLWGKVLGKGRPVLLLHGVTANAYVWEPVAELLSGSLSVVAVDQRGHGTVAGVVAIDFTPFIEPPVLETLGARVAAGDRSFADLDEVRAYLRRRYPLLPDDAIQRRALHGYREIADGRLRPLADPEAMRQSCASLAEDLAPALALMQVPGVLVRGASSALVSPEAFRRTQRLRPDLPTIEVTGADHYVPEERPAAVADIVLRFADRFSAERANNRVAGEG
jgi:2-(acetamidomethylene)succinate hydrolase